MAIIQITLSEVSPADAKRATKLVATYRETCGSNRGNWGRVALLIGYALTVLRGRSVEVTEAFPITGSKLYHTAHRSFSSGAVRPYWSRVYVIGLRNCSQVGNVITGETTTTNAERVVIVPAK